MPGFEQDQGTNLKLKSASRLETEKSEILNSGSTQRVETLFNESFSLAACNRCHMARPKQQKYFSLFIILFLFS